MCVEYMGFWIIMSQSNWFSGRKWAPVRDDKSRRDLSMHFFSSLSLSLSFLPASSFTSFLSSLFFFSFPHSKVILIQRQVGCKHRWRKMTQYLELYRKQKDFFLFIGSLRASFQRKVYGEIFRGFFHGLLVNAVIIRSLLPVIFRNHHIFRAVLPAFLEVLNALPFMHMAAPSEDAPRAERRGFQFSLWQTPRSVLSLVCLGPLHLSAPLLCKVNCGLPLFKDVFLFLSHTGSLCVALVGLELTL